MKTSSDGQIIAPFLEIGFAESNGDVRILLGSSHLVVCAHSQNIFDQKNSLDLRRAVWRPSSCNAYAVATLSSYLVIITIRSPDIICRKALINADELCFFVSLFLFFFFVVSLGIRVSKRT